MNFKKHMFPAIAGLALIESIFHPITNKINSIINKLDPLIEVRWVVDVYKNTIEPDFFGYTDAIYTFKGFDKTYTGSIGDGPCVIVKREDIFRYVDDSTLEYQINASIDRDRCLRKQTLKGEVKFLSNEELLPRILNDFSKVRRNNRNNNLENSMDVRYGSKKNQGTSITGFKAEYDGVTYEIPSLVHLANGDTNLVNRLWQDRVVYREEE